MDRVAFFRAYLQDKPEDRFAMYSLALELKKSGDPEAAERAFEALLAAHPGSGAGYYQLGELYREQGRDAEAANAWRRGLAALVGQTDPDARKARAELAAALDALE